MIVFCSVCGVGLNDVVEIVRKGKRVCRRCAEMIDAMDEKNGQTISRDWEEIVQMLSMIKQQARDNGRNVLIEDISLDSLSFVIDSAMELIQYEND